MNEKYIPDVIEESQRDNWYKPISSCYNTSNGIVITTLLNRMGLNKTAIGCPTEQQIEDFIYEKIYCDNTTKKYLRDNVNFFGNWILSFVKTSKSEGGLQTVAAAEEYVFNSLMNKYGYGMKFRTGITWDGLKRLLDTDIPQIVHGNYKSVSGVAGHITVATGYKEFEGGRFIQMIDPYGDANTGYKDKEVKRVFYDFDKDFFIRERSNPLWITTIEKL